MIPLAQGLSQLAQELALECNLRRMLHLKWKQFVPEEIQSAAEHTFFSIVDLASCARDNFYEAPAKLNI